MSVGEMLKGITVVEISSSVAAPFAARIMADLGADVYKIEPPGDGDAARRWGPPFWRGDATPFHAFNRGKRSVAVDLKDPPSRDVLRNFIVAKADVVIQNLRAGLIETFELDGINLLKVAPRLIYCNMGGFGSKGPMRSQMGYEALIQAITGLISVTGEPDRDPVRLGIPAADMGTGMWAVIGILAALQRRQTTGKGHIVEASLYDTGLGWTSMVMAQYQATGAIPQRQGLKGTSLVPNGGFRAADGMLMLTVGTDVQFQSLCRAVGRPELAQDPKYITNADRRAHEDELVALLNDTFLTKPRADWCSLLTASGVAAIPVQDLAEVANSEQTAASEMLQDCPGDDLHLIGLPIRIDGERPRPRNAAPACGELPLAELLRHGNK